MDIAVHVQLLGKLDFQGTRLKNGNQLSGKIAFLIGPKGLNLNRKEHITHNFDP